MPRSFGSVSLACVPGQGDTCVGDERRGSLERTGTLMAWGGDVNSVGFRVQLTVLPGSLRDNAPDALYRTDTVKIGGKTTPCYRIALSSAAIIST